MQPIDFSLLKEYDSLSKRQQQLLSEIEQENLRLTKINRLIEEHLSRRHEIRNNISEYNTLILDKDSQVRLLVEQRTRITHQGASTEKLQDYQEKIEQLENDSFALLEKIEELEIELTETVEFEKGARKTLSEIEQEVSHTVQEKQTEVARNKNHLEEILSSGLSERVANVLKKLMDKNLTHGPFTKIQAGSCMMCRFKISKIDEAEIDVHRLLKQCPQCARIFIPYGI